MMAAHIAIGQFEPAGSPNHWLHPELGLCVGRDGQSLESFVAEYESAAAAGPQPVPVPVPHEISDRQFAHQLAKAQIITQAEALAFVATGTVPVALQAIVDAIPDVDARFDAQMILSGAVVFKRAHPLTAAIGAAYGFSPEQMDAFFAAAAAL